MEQIKTENPLGYKKIPSLLASFAVPSIISMLVSSLYNVVDQIFIGRGVGYYGNAATTVAFPLTTICMAITLTIGIGSAAQFSLHLGRKEEEHAASVVGNGCAMMTVFGISYAILAEIFLPYLLKLFGATAEVYPYAFSYTRIVILGMPFLVAMNGLSNLARADGSPLYSMTTMMIGAVVNTVLDPVFIFVLDWGVAGGAAATVIGQVCSFVSAVLYLPKFKRVHLKVSCFRLRKQLVLRTLTMGMSNGLTQLALTLVQIVMNLSLVYYGGRSRFGSDIPLAASGVVMKTFTLLLAFVIGINQGMQPIVGFNYGAGKFDRVKSTYLHAVGANLVICAIGFFCFQVFPRQIISLYGKGESDVYYDFGVMFMRIFLMMSLVNGVQMISSNFFAAIGKPVKGALLALTRQVFFLIPLILVFGWLFGITGVVAAAPVADFCSFIVVLVFIVKELKSYSTRQA